MNHRIDTFREEMKAYRVTIVDETAIAVYDEIVDKFNNIYEPAALKILEGAKTGTSQESLISEMREIVGTANEIADCLTNIISIRMNVMSTANDAGTKLGNILLATIIVSIILAIVISIVFALYIANLISKPLLFIKNILYEIGARGRVNFSEEEYRRHTEKHR